MRTRAASASVGDADPVTEQFACHGIFTELIDDGWRVLPLCETDDPVARGTFPSTRSKIALIAARSPFPSIAFAIKLLTRRCNLVWPVRLSTTSLSCETSSILKSLGNWPRDPIASCGATMQPFYPGFAALQPQEIVAVARSTGLDPTGSRLRPMLLKNCQSASGIRKTHSRGAPTLDVIRRVFENARRRLHRRKQRRSRRAAP
jgi:hypothetical protein